MAKTEFQSGAVFEVRYAGREARCLCGHYKINHAGGFDHCMLAACECVMFESAPLHPHTCHGNEHMPPGPCLACDLERPARGATDAAVGSASESTGASASAEPQTPELDETCTDGYCTQCGAIALAGADYCESHIPPPPAAPVSSDARPAREQERAAEILRALLRERRDPSDPTAQAVFKTCRRGALNWALERGIDALLSGGAK